MHRAPDANRWLALLGKAKTRQYLYAVASAVLTLAIAYGFIAPEHAPLWLGVAASVLAVGATTTAAVATKAQRAAGLL